VKEGDRLSLQPKNLEVRVKGLQSHGQNRPELALGDRAAVNLHGVTVEEIERGNVLVSSGYLEPTYIFTSSFYLLGSAKKLDSRTRVRVHAGTHEVLGRIVLLDRDSVEPGQHCFAELRLEEQMNIAPEERFVVRSYSPQFTIGGGQILTINEKKSKRHDTALLDVLSALEKGDQNKLVEETLFLSRFAPVSIPEVSKKVGWSEEETVKSVEKLQAEKKIVRIGKEVKREFYHKANFETLQLKTSEVLEKFHTEFTHKDGMSKEELKTKISPVLDTDLFDAVISIMSQNRIDIANNIVSLKKFKVQIDPKMQKNIDSVLDCYKDDGFTPKTVKEMAEELNIPFKEVRQYAGMLASKGELVKIDEDFYISKDVLEKGKELIRAEIGRSGPLKIGQISELFGSSRKYVVPIVEYLDKSGFTRRNGDVREMG
jgi:selenocysteine-specific elongation factor